MTAARAPDATPLEIALTGNVASGKSTVARLFTAWGAHLIDADAIVHDLQAPGTPVTSAIAGRFGPGVLREDGSVDRDALRHMVLADPAAREDLNAIVHPAVERRRQEALAAAWAAGARVIVHDIPLLFEVLDPAAFDRVVLVDAPEDVRMDRLTRLRGLDPAEARRLISTQMPAALKRDRSDEVIENDGDLEQLERRARAAWDRLVGGAPGRA